ncbi:MAG TPA: methyltransferase domain-containing protein [Crenotrichaceae bacterium]|nr:methyltransferase domain-containing protein [Crenotrichaceae bacterium]
MPELLMLQKMRRWYSSAIGQHVLETEQVLIDEALSRLFGYELLQIEQLTSRNLHQVSQIKHHMVLSKDTSDSSNFIHLYGRYDALPITTDSIDVVLLHHTLELTQSPGQVLREIDRILIPEGHVVICGFNPYSLLGLWQVFSKQKTHAPWCGHFHGISHVKQWLREVGFDIVEQHNYCFRPPIQQQKIMQNLKILESTGARWYPQCGGAYMLVAKKRVITYTPIKPRWWPKKVIASSLSQPTLRNYKVDNKK